MKRKLLIHIILFFCMFLVGQQFVIRAAMPSTKPKTIIIDPWYGGKERGPLIAQNEYGKNITLGIAQKLKGQLEASGFIVYLTRSEDKYVPVEDRSFQGKAREADIHLAIKVSQSDKDCMHLLIPESLIPKSEANTATHETTEEMNKAINRIINDLKAEEIQEYSLLLAHKIANNFKKGLLLDCVEVRRGKSYLLKNAKIPTVLVDFRVLPADKEPFITIDASLDKAARLTADSIAEHFDDRKKGSVTN